MNVKKVAATTKLWLAAQDKKAQAVTGEDAFWASRDIAKVLPLMIDAYASPADEQALTPASLIEEYDTAQDDEEEEASRKKFDYYCIPASPAMFALVEAVWMKWCAYQSLFSRHGASSKQFGEDNDKFLLSTCLSNIVNAELTDPSSEGVTITRDKVSLSLHSRYRPQVFNVRFLTVVDGLVGCGMLLQTKGLSWHGPIRPAQSWQTILHSSAALRALMAEHGVTAVRDTKWDRTGQEIILRKKDKTSRLEEYSDLDVIANGYRAEVREINEMFSRANITVLNRTGAAFIDERDRFVQRQFTYQSWRSGGRLLGGFWTPMHKEERVSRILLNGETTVELDYNSIGYHALYAQARAAMPQGDVYRIAGMDQASRAGIKKLMLSLTFDKKANRSRFPKGSSVLFSEADRTAGARVAIAKIKSHHVGVAYLLGANKGHELQFIESQVLIAVLLKVKSEGLIGLPIHDCLLVPRSQVDRVKTIMEDVSLRVSGIRVPVKIQATESEQ